MMPDVDKCDLGKISHTYPSRLLTSLGGQLGGGLGLLSTHSCQSKWHLGWTKCSVVMHIESTIPHAIHF